MTQPSGGNSLFWANSTRSPVVSTDAAGPVLLSDGFSQFSVMTASDGALKWTSPWAVGTGSVFVLGGMVVRVNLDSLQRARDTYIDATTGRELWSLLRSPGQQYSLMVIGETLVASVGDTVFAGLDRLTGREKWRTRLGAPSCVAPVLCFGMKPIGVDGTDGYVLRQTSLATQIITVRESGIARQVDAQNDTLLRVFSSTQMSPVTGAGMIAIWSQNQSAAGIDVQTGVVRWRTDFSAIAPAGFQLSAYDWRYSASGKILSMRFNSATSNNYTSLDLLTGQRLQSVAVVPTVGKRDVLSACGSEGLTRLTETGLEFINLRTGARTQLNVAGLYDAAIRENVISARAVGSDRMLLLNGISSPVFGVRCAP